MYEIDGYGNPYVQSRMYCIYEWRPHFIYAKLLAES